MTTQIRPAKTITVPRDESGFDRACDYAYRMAVDVFGIDDNGHCDSIPEWERSCCWLEVRFTDYKRVGSEHQYTFEAAPFKHADEDDDI